MNYQKQHDIYLQRVAHALDTAVQKYLMPGSTVSEAGRYALLNGGKRVRGVLVQAVADMLGASSPAADAFSVAIEMIHAFSLVHDDLPCMDDDDIRRGKPATHIAFGEATALLAGDMLALQAFEVAADVSGLQAKQALQAQRVLAAAAGARGMIYGQELDLAYENAEVFKENALWKIQRYKTGALIRAAVELGILAAEQDPQAHPVLLQYAEKIGIVFQIVDDVLDEVSSTEVLGKPVGSDKESGKMTSVAFWGVARAQEEIARLTAESVQALQNEYGDNALFLKEYAESLAARAK